MNDGRFRYHIAVDDIEPQQYTTLPVMKLTSVFYNTIIHTDPGREPQNTRLYSLKP